MPSFFPPNILPFAIGGPNILTQNLAALGILPPLWGIFGQGSNALTIANIAATILGTGGSVIEFDNVVSFEYRQDWTVADYPIEEGGFLSYDKVQTPYNIKMTFSAGGPFFNRQAFLESVAAAAKTLKLYDVVTPEVTYKNCNITHYDYERRADRGAGLIQVTIWLIEIRLIKPKSAANTAAPSGSSTTSLGNVQAQDASYTISGGVV